MHEPAFLAATEALFAATADPNAWATALQKVSDAVGGFDTHLFSWRHSGGGMSFSATGKRLPDEAESLYDKHYGALDPRLGLVAHSRAGSWFSCADQFDNDYVSRSEFFSDFLIPMGVRYLYGTKLFEDRHEAAFLGFHRSPAMGSFDAAAMRDARRISQVINAAFRVRQRISDLTSELIRQRAMLDRLPWALFVVSQDALLHYANKQGEEMLRRGDAIRLVLGRLSTCDEATTQSFKSVVRRAGQADATGYLNTVRTLERFRTPFGEYQITIAPLSQEIASGLPATANEVLVILSDTIGGSLRGISALREAYGLTTAEARVAQLLATGKRPDQIANELGVGLQTVKTHLRAIFDKTGTSRQSELVQAVLLIPSVT